MGTQSLGMKVRLFLLAGMACLAGSVCWAQEEAAPSAGGGGFWQGVARTAPFGKPFWADVHSTVIRAEMGLATNSPDYDWGEYHTKVRPFVFANLGADIPMWAGSFADGKYGLSVTLPFMMDVWFDRFEWITSPIINTAYRFGAFDACFIYRLDAPLTVFPRKEESSAPAFLRFTIYNWSLKFSFFKHESTHIGDELTIFRQDHNLPITRVDVAYNYGELVFTLNDPDGHARRNHGFKVGLLMLHNFKTGWYQVFDEDAPQPGLVEPSRIPVELYVQYQYQSALFSRGFQFIASVEYRLRERYRYPFFKPGAASDFSQYNGRSGASAASCVNIFAGIRYDSRQPRNYFSKIGVGIRYYYGINPYGQFRSMPRYHQWGAAVIFE